MLFCFSHMHAHVGAAVTLRRTHTPQVRVALRLRANAGPPSGVWSGRGPPRLPLRLPVGARAAPTNPGGSLRRWRWWSDATAAATRSSSSCGACHNFAASRREKEETEKEQPRRIVVEHEPEPRHVADLSPSYQGRLPGAKRAGLASDLVCIYDFLSRRVHSPVWLRSHVEREDSSSVPTAGERAGLRACCVCLCTHQPDVHTMGCSCCLFCIGTRACSHVHRLCRLFSRALSQSPNAAAAL